MERINLSLQAYLGEVDETAIIPTGATTYGYLYAPTSASSDVLYYKAPSGTKYDLIANAVNTVVSGVSWDGDDLTIGYSDGSSSAFTITDSLIYVSGGSYNSSTGALTLNRANGSNITISNVKTPPAGSNGTLQYYQSGQFASNSYLGFNGTYLYNVDYGSNAVRGLWSNILWLVDNATVGSPSNGMIRYYNNRFQGRSGGQWVYLDASTTDTYVTGGTLVGQNLTLGLYGGTFTDPIDLSGLFGGVGSGNQNYLTKWSSTTGLTNSQVYDDGTNVGIGITSGTTKLTVAGAITAISGATTGTSTQWNEAYDQRGSQIAGNGLTWDGSQLNVTGGTGGAAGTGTIDYISKWASSSALTDSLMYESGTTVYVSGSVNILNTITNSEKKVNHTIGGANFYSGGGDNGGVFDGDYSIYVGEEAGSGLTVTGSIYHINTSFGYASLKGANELTSMTAIGAGAGRETIADPNPPVGGSLNGAGVIIGASAARSVDKYNASVVIGSYAGFQVETIARSTIVGNDSFDANAGSTGVTLYKVTSLGSFLGHQPSIDNANFEHIIAIGHEALLYSTGATDSILIGDYIGMDSGLNDSIFIGNYRTSGSTITKITGTTDNVISIGHFVLPEQEYTINFPTGYSMGLGTLAPSQKLHVAGSVRINNHIFDSSNSSGTTNYVLTSTPTGITWALSSGSGGTQNLEQVFNTSPNANVDSKSLSPSWQLDSITINSVNNSTIYGDSGNTVFQAGQEWLISGAIARMYEQSGYILISGASDSFSGMVYNADYSANFKPNTLITKQYLDDNNIYVTGGSATSSTLTLKRRNGINIGIDVSSVGADSYGQVWINQGRTYTITGTEDQFIANSTNEIIEFVDSNRISVYALTNPSFEYGLQFDIREDSIYPALLNMNNSYGANKMIVTNSTSEFRYQHTSTVDGEVSVTTDSINVDVTNVSMVVVNASGNPISISGFTGGEDGQVIYIIKEDSADVITLEVNNGSADQPIIGYSSGVVLLGDSNVGATLINRGGTEWYIVGK